MFGEPGQTAYDLRFSLFGIPVRIHPLFWAVAIIFSPFLRGNSSDLRLLSAGLIGWLAAWTLTFLIHEFGHALVIRKIYGARPWIVFYGFGGLTIHQPFYRRLPGRWGQMLISFAGPGMQLIGVAVMLALFRLLGTQLMVGDFSRIGPIPIPMILPAWIPFQAENIGLLGNMVNQAYLSFIVGFVWMGIAWSILNLIPIYPLDGGQIARQFFQQIDPSKGLASSLILSMVLAGLLTLTSFQNGDQFIGLFFGFFALMNYRQYQMIRLGR